MIGDVTYALCNSLSSPRPIAEGGKRSIFLTNTVVLAHQQKICIERATSLKVSVYTGDMNVDAWRKDQWYGEFESNQVNNSWRTISSSNDFHFIEIICPSFRVGRR